MKKHILRIITFFLLFSGFLFYSGNSSEVQAENDTENIAASAENNYIFTDFTMNLFNYDYEMRDFPVPHLEVFPMEEFNMVLKSSDNAEEASISESCFEENDIIKKGWNCYYVTADTAPGTYQIAYRDEFNNISAELTVTVKDWKADEMRFLRKYLEDETWGSSPIEMSESENDTNVFLLEDYPAAFTLGIESHYFIDDVVLPDGYGPKVSEITNWQSSDPSIATVNEFGSVTLHNTGECYISCTAAGIDMKTKLFVKSKGIYFNQHQEITHLVLGKSWDWNANLTILGDLVPDQPNAANADIMMMNMILDDDTLDMLKSKNLLGRTVLRQFTPDESCHTIWAVKGMTNTFPLSNTDLEMDGLTLTGYLAFPKKESCHCYDNVDLFSIQGSGKNLFEVCDCYLDDNKLNDVYLTNPDGSVQIVKKVPFTIEILADTPENNMICIEGIENTLAQNQTLSTEQICYAASLLYQIEHKTSAYDPDTTDPTTTDFPLPAYTSADYTRISQLIEKVFHKKLTIIKPDDVSISNFILCAKANELDVPEQTIRFEKNKLQTSQDSLREIHSGETVIGTYDFQISRQQKGEARETITETPVPLQITLDLGEDLSGQNIKIIREHKDAKGKLWIDTLDAIVDGTKVTFTSDRYSAYTFVKTEEDSEQTDTKPTNPDTDSQQPEDQKDPDKGSPASADKTAGSVKTGDNTLLFVWFALLLLCGIIAVKLMTSRQK